MYRILYVDDEPALLEVGKLFLEQRGKFTVDTITSAQGALTLLDTTSYDAIISDYQMPGMDGLALLKEVRSSGNKIPFILFTGRGREEVVIQALNAGADFYLQKGGEPKSQFAELSNKIQYAVINRSAEVALRNSQRMLEEAMDLANLVNWECDIDTGMLTFDDRFSTLYGTPAKRKGINHMTAEAYLSEVVHPDDLHVLLDEDEKTRNMTDPHYKSRREYRIIRGDGEIRYIDMCVGITKNAEGRTIKTHGVNQDITERKTAEMDLRRAYEQITVQEEELRVQYDSMVTMQQRTAESQQMLTAVLNTVPARVFWKDTTLRFLGCNESFIDDAGLSDPSDLIGKSDLDMVWKEQALQYRADDQQIIDTGIPKIGYEETQSSSGGCQIHVRTSKVPLRNPDGHIIGILGTYEDITEQKRADEALRESEKKFRTLVEHSLDGILITDFTGKILFVNRAAGRVMDVEDYETLTGKRNVLEFIAPEFRDEVIRDLYQVSQGIDAYLVHYRLITETKRERRVECIGKKIAFGNSPAMLVSVRDVSEREQAEAELLESENKFATVFRCSPVPLTLVSLTDGKFVDVNDAFVRSTGYSREEVIGISAQTLGIFTDRNENEHFVSMLRDKRRVQGLEMKCRTKAGALRTCRISCSIILIRGKPYLLSSIEDITERKDTDTAYQAMIKSVVGTTGLDSLQKITEIVSTWLGAECVMIGEIQPDNLTVDAAAMILDGKVVPDFSYTLKGTPCENVREKGLCLYPDNVRQLFPESRDLAELNICGYLGIPLRNSGGQVFGIFCVLSRSPLQVALSVQEIMEVIAVKASAELERARIERALTESEEKFRTIFKNSPSPICINSIPDGKFLAVNEAFITISGYAESEVLGKNPLDLGVLSFGDYDRLSSHLLGPGCLDNMSMAIGGKGGKRVHIQASTIPVTINGRSAIISTAAEITKLKQAEEELLQKNDELRRTEQVLRESEARFRTILESMQSCIVIIDARTYRILDTNPKALEMIGETRESVIGSDCHRFLCPADEGKCPVTDLGQTVDSSERILLTHGGKKIPILKSVVKTMLEGREVLVESFVDISERKKVEEALRRANGQLSLLTGITRHDITNQLMVLNGNIELLHRNAPDPSLNHHFARIAKASNQISAMIRFTKEYEKIGANDPAWQECRALVDSAAAGTTLGNVVMINDLSSESEIFADTLIVKVFYNLIDNAIRYGGKITTIRFSTDLQNGNRVMVCEDDGEGIPAEEKERIFDRGYGRNTGLGLAISREILDITGITIHETGTPGRGARFEMVIPNDAYRPANSQPGD
ncbi:PAS domain S-box protein [Methanoregula sp.]|uniref:PAS domain S-box protein n=1 Tax=Methanoregula sp. TaxID=2052170 RepID=UPI00236FE7CF|nr:PAS domain S-box protein [Methanoregula sp.]MDD1685815.1 PAS domain S-box protein [Methanoregula sp.]